MFNTIRWGLVMVPVNALEATTATFVGHEWGAFRGALEAPSPPRALGPAGAAVRRVVRPAGRSVLLALAVEVPLCLFMALWGVEPFARFLSQSASVARITRHMWRTIDWCYVFYAVNAQLAAVLLASRAGLYLAQSLAANLLWVLPWAVVAQVHGLHSGDPWRWYALVFGGGNVFSSVVLLPTLVYWARSALRMARAKDGGSWRQTETTTSGSAATSAPSGPPRKTSDFSLWG